MNKFLFKFALYLSFSVVGLVGLLVSGKLSSVHASIGTYAVYADFCSQNSGTLWQVQYKVKLADGSYTSYFPGGVWTSYGGDSAACAASFGSSVSGVLANQAVSNIDPDTAKMIWWTQCADPEERPNVTGGTFINFAANVTGPVPPVPGTQHPGGDNLGSVVATDSSGASCPVSVPVSPPGAFGLANETTACSSGTQATATLSWNVSGGATSYDVYYGVNGGSIAYQASAGNATSWTNNAFTSGADIQWHILANKAGTSGTWSNETWLFKTKTPCPPTGTSTPDPFSISVNFQCNGTTQTGLSISGASGGATGYKIYWVSSASGNPIPGGYRTTVGSLPYTNWTFNPGGDSLNVAVAATNASGDTPATNNYLTGTVPSLASCGSGGGGPIGVTLTANPPSITSGGSSRLDWTTSGSPTGCSSTFTASPSTGGGSYTVFPASTTTYSITCTKAGVPNAVATAQVTVGGGGGPSTITIVKQGSGTGTVSGSGLNCGSTCSVAYLPGAAISLTETLGGSSTFGGWSGPCGGAGSTCSFTLGANTTVFATFNGGPAAQCSWSPSTGLTPGTNSTLSITGSWPAYNWSLLPSAGYTWVSNPPIVYQFNTPNTTWTFTATNQSTGAFLFSCSVSTTSAPPVTAVINASPLTIDYNTTSTISWSSTNATSCTINKAVSLFSNALNSAGTSSGNLTLGTQFTISCSGPGGSASNLVDVQVRPQNPGSLTATTSCAGSAPQVIFSWSQSGGGPSGYYVDVNNSEWTGDNSPSPWGWAQINGYLNTSYSWLSGAPLNGGPPTVPQNDTVYYWRVKAFSTSGVDGYHVYPPSTTTPSGTSFKTPQCAVPSALNVFTAPCASGPYAVNLNWSGPTSSWWIDLSTSSTFASYSNKNVVSGNTTVAPTGFSPNLNLLPGVNYYWRMWYGVAGTWMYWNGNASGGTTNQAAATPFTTPWCKPTNLRLDPLPACATSAGYNPTFRWDGAAGGNWYLNIDDNGNWGDAADRSKQITPLGAMSTDGTGLSPALTFLPGTPYRWNIWYGEGTGATAHFILPASTEVIGNPPAGGSFPYTFNVPACVDLDMNDVGSQLEFYTDATYTTIKTPPAYNAGETMYVQAKVKNVGAAISSPFKVAFYLQNGAPTCGLVPGGINPGTEKTLSSLASGATDTWQFTIPAPILQSVLITASVFADYTCVIAEGPGAPAEANNIKTKNYSVDIKAWFETKGGDVGTGGCETCGITASIANPASKYQSDYLIVGNVLDAKVTSAKWKISGYTGKLMPAGTYSYLADRFKTKAQLVPQCSFGSLVTGLAYCSGNVTLGASVLAAGKNVVWFIDGDLTITGDVTVDPTSAIAFIVSGDVKVQTPVSRLDGIYTVGKSFTDVTDASTLQGKQLVVKGSVYTEGVNGIKLDRKLASGASSMCTATGEPGIVCDNSQNPAESFRFDPKYLINLATIIATPAVSWQEVAP